MKLRITDRILAALNALILLWIAACMISDVFMGGRCFKLAERLIAGAVPLPWLVGVMAALVIIAALNLSVLLRQGKSKHGFVIQKTENGELSISIRAIEGLVQKCVNKHEELHVSSTSLVNTRSGLVIKLRISMAGGMNIPLVVNGLQKQIKQYITACSGVDVKEVKVQVESSAAKMKDSPYVVPEMLSDAPAAATVELDEAPVEETSQEEAKEEKCLHQRLFGQEEQPAIVPAPPAGELPEAPAEEEPSGEAEDEVLPPVAEESPAQEEPAPEVEEDGGLLAAEETALPVEDAAVTEEEKHEIAQ